MTLQDRRVVRDGSAESSNLAGAGWVVIARSWGAGLTADPDTIARLRRAVDGGVAGALIRPLDATDVDSVLRLDALTAADYVGDVATAHEALTLESAAPDERHRAWGAFDGRGDLIGMTYMWPDAGVTETDFTVVHPDWRGRGVATALKATAVLALIDEGHTTFRTGGSADNAAMLRADLALGYVVDEHWLTVAPPADTT